jgi:hypothetical protein
LRYSAWISAKKEYAGAENCNIYILANRIRTIKESQMATIDADAHVLETPITWEHMDPEHKKFAPMVVTQASGEQMHGSSGNVMLMAVFITSK